MELIKKLSKIQKELKAPKNQRNNFGNYNYRSCEDILEAVKPLLTEDLALTISDEIIRLGETTQTVYQTKEFDSQKKQYFDINKISGGDRFYVKATVTLSDGKDSISVNAYARESEDKKGMDTAQITGAASSYARKYALNGLFLIDDTKDADTMDNKQEVRQTAKPSNIPALSLLRSKIGQEAKGKKLTEEETIKIITDKSGVVLKDLKGLDEQTSKNIIEMWS